LPAWNSSSIVHLTATEVLIPTADRVHGAGIRGKTGGPCGSPKAVSHKQGHARKQCHTSRATPVSLLAVRVRCVARLTRTPPDNGRPENRTLAVCELAVPEAPHKLDPGCILDVGESAPRGLWLGDVARRFPLLGIVESSLRMVRPRDSQQCHTSRATPVTRAGPRPSHEPVQARHARLQAVRAEYGTAYSHTDGKRQS
jgi:hypothetical protein